MFNVLWSKKKIDDVLIEFESIFQSIDQFPSRGLADTKVSMATKQLDMATIVTNHRFRLPVASNKAKLNPAEQENGKMLGKKIDRVAWSIRNITHGKHNS